MAIDPDQNWNIANEVLTAVVTHYAAEKVALPTRRYVSPGLPAWDCEQCCVYVSRSYGHSGDVAQPTTEPMYAAAGWGARAIVVSVQVTRCVPVPNQRGNARAVSLTRVEDEQEAAQAIYADGQLCMNAVVAGVRNGALTKLNSVAFLDWDIVGPDGGFVGSTLDVVIATDALGAGTS